MYEQIVKKDEISPREAMVYIDKVVTFVLENGLAENDRELAIAVGQALLALRKTVVDFEEQNPGKTYTICVEAGCYM